MFRLSFAVLLLGCGAASSSVSEPSPPPPQRSASPAPAADAPAAPAAAAGDKSNLIRVSTPQSGALVHSPLRVAGEARGPWYFEASFPVALLDGEGRLLVQSHAQAQAEWMTEAFVPFEAELSFAAPTTAKGTLVLEKDNPSGLPEHADELRIPVRFEPPAATR